MPVSNREKGTRILIFRRVMYEKKEKKSVETGNGLTSLAELGEFGLIERLTRNVKRYHPETLKGIGDDAAVIDAGNKVILLSTDLLVEGIHFDFTYMPFKHLGYKAAVVNISDIAAMNGIPKQMTVSLAVSSRFSAEALDELYAGVVMACNKYKVDLVGGDTSSNVKGLMISVSIIGEKSPNWYWKISIWWPSPAKQLQSWARPARSAQVGPDRDV